MRFTICTLLGCALFAGIATAQPPLPVPGQRAPDDQIEGTIWEFKATVKKTGDKEKDAEQPTLDGKFRIEGAGIFDVSPTFRLPTKKEVKKVVDKVLAGEGGEVKLPAKPQQKRLGDAVKRKDGTYRLDFSSKEEGGLNGIMILWPKKNTNDVLTGTFDQREGTKTVRRYDVQFRPIED